MRRLRCGSSVYIHRKSFGSRSPLASAAAALAGSGSSLRPSELRDVDEMDERDERGVADGWVLPRAVAVLRGAREEARAVVDIVEEGGVGCGDGRRRGWLVGKGDEGRGGHAGRESMEMLRCRCRRECRRG